MGNKTSKTTKNKPVMLFDGSLYNGGILEGKPHGTGRLKDPQIGVYEGGFIHGYKSGTGKIFYINGEFYNGEW